MSKEAICKNCAFWGKGNLIEHESNGKLYKWCGSPQSGQFYNGGIADIEVTREDFGCVCIEVTREDFGCVCFSLSSGKPSQVKFSPKSRVQPLFKKPKCSVCGDTGMPCKSCHEFHRSSCPPHEVRMKGMGSINAACPECGKKPCKTCGGSGRKECDDCSSTGECSSIGHCFTCPFCDGKGDVPCPECGKKPVGEKRKGVSIGPARLSWDRPKEKTAKAIELTKARQPKEIVNTTCAKCKKVLCSTNKKERLCPNCQTDAAEFVKEVETLKRTDFDNFATLEQIYPIIQKMSDCLDEAVALIEKLQQ